MDKATMESTIEAGEELRSLLNATSLQINKFDAWIEDVQNKYEQVLEWSDSILQRLSTRQRQTETDKENDSYDFSQFEGSYVTREMLHKFMEKEPVD